MRKTAVTAIWAGVVLSALSGCGTAHNFMGDTANPGACEVFGGVRSDVSTGVKCLRNPAEGQGDGAMKDYDKLAGLYLLAVDLPLSAAADTVTLPWTVMAQLVGRPAPSESQPGQPQKAAHATEGPAAESQ